jgi:hypothetical protein
LAGIDFGPLCRFYYYFAHAVLVKEEREGGEKLYCVLELEKKCYGFKKQN